MPSVGVPASPWMWAKARSEQGALTRLCGDGVVSNEARNGVILYGNQREAAVGKAKTEQFVIG
jgi:hypothetical protein